MGSIALRNMRIMPQRQKTCGRRSRQSLLRKLTVVFCDRFECAIDIRMIIR